MKKIAIYGLIAAQVIVVAFLVFFFERFENYAEEIKVSTKIEYAYMEEAQIVGDIYVEYNINEIDKDISENVSDLKYNRPVYVVLQENENGIYEVTAISDKKLKAQDDRDVVLRAIYNYKDERTGKTYVRYGFEYIEDIEEYGSFQEKDELLVTVLVGKWGQQQIKTIEKVEE